MYPRVQGGSHHPAINPPRVQVGRAAHAIAGLHQLVPGSVQTGQYIPLGCPICMLWASRIDTGNRGGVLLGHKEVAAMWVLHRVVQEERLVGAELSMLRDNLLSALLPVERPVSDIRYEMCDTWYSRFWEACTARVGSRREFLASVTPARGSQSRTRRRRVARLCRERPSGGCRRSHSGRPRAWCSS
eukprot:COSAG05_NODE_3185_length_2260_cov_2.344285_4_plen_187_part_00